MTNNDLIYKIKRMKKVEPSNAWLVSNKEFILKYIELDKAEAKENNAFAASNSFNFSEIKSRLNFISAIFQHKVLAGSAAMAVVLLLAAGAVAGEAEGSLPGDRLYAVKTFMEKAQMAFAFNEEKRIALNFELTEKRFDEFSTMVAAKKESSSSETVKTAANNFKNQLKVAAQELNNAKNGADAEKAVSVAKIADTKTSAYAKKLSEVKKELSDKKQDQVEDVAGNIEELGNNALAVLAANSKVGDLNAEEIAAKVKEKITETGEKIDLTQKNALLYEAEIKASNAENKEAAESLVLSEKLISEAKAVLSDAQLSFEKSDFSKTWDLLTNANEIIKVAESVSSRATIAPSAELTVTPIVSPPLEPSAAPSLSVEPSVSPAPTNEILPTAAPSNSALPKAIE